MKKYLLLFVLGAFLITSCSNEKPRVLVFSKTKGYRHQSIMAGKAALQKLGVDKGFEIDTTESSDVFTEDSLKKYKAVIFLSTTGDVLNQAQQNEFMRFIQAGGGYLGIHAAADTEYDWWWYGKLVGAYFKSHPEQQNSKRRALMIYPRAYQMTGCAKMNCTITEKYLRISKCYTRSMNRPTRAVRMVTIILLPGITILMGVVLSTRAWVTQMNHLWILNT
jgi:hypothetical protein